jgi:hypothetical protein
MANTEVGVTDACSVGDDPEFERLVRNWPAEWVNLCAFVDAYAAERYRDGFIDGQSGKDAPLE